MSKSEENKDTPSGEGHELNIENNAINVSNRKN